MQRPGAWQRFLAKQDLVWRRVPTSFFEAPFLGNGGLGAAMYKDSGSGRLKLLLGDSRVHDHQDVAGPVTNNGQTAEMSTAVWGQSRLPVGHLVLKTVGEVIGVDWQLSLWDAELAGTVTTTAGRLELRAFVHATREILAVSLSPTSGERDFTWSFEPAEASSPRAAHNTPPADLRANPQPRLTTDAEGGRCVQDLVAGGQHTTAWRERRDRGGRGRTLVATVATSYPDRTAEVHAVAAVAAGAAQHVDHLARDHAAWWHRFYPKSFVSVPDARLQSFYWIQLYKLASATRANRPVIGTAAQWLEDTGWPATWWNLNVQLEYWPIYATGHTELDSLTRSLDECRDNLALNVPEEYRADSYAIGRTTQENLRGAEVAVPGTVSKEALPEVGNLTWAIHNAWLAYRHTMDEDQLRDVVFPLLRRAVGFYLHFLVEGTDGRLHLPTTFSPEYDITSDCNYDLALLSWGCRTLLDASERLGIEDELRGRWQEVTERLVDAPQGTDGLWIGADRRLTSSHRHFSHLLWFYPLALYDVSDADRRDLLERSLAHWLSFTGALQGYTFTGAASMSSMLGDGDRAVDYLNTLLETYIKPNTMYAEGSPVFETPPSGAQSLHDMLFSARGGVIRVFPAVPSAWQEVTIADVRLEGGFVLSSARRAGRTDFVRIRSTAGEPCRVVPGFSGPYDVRPSSHRTPRPRWREHDGLLEIDLDKGDEVVVVRRGTRPDLRLDPVATDRPGPTWGLL